MPSKKSRVEDNKMAMTIKMHRFVVNLKPELFEKLREIAFKEKISISKLIMKYIEKEIN